MTRRNFREHLFRMLFETGFHDEHEFEEQYRLYWSTKDDVLSEEDNDEFRKKLKDVRAKIDQIDPLIDKSSKGWKLNRIGTADLNILRIAIYEMKYDDNVPVKVAINEAVELAKIYGTDNSPAFVNGILANVAKKCEEDK